MKFGFHIGGFLDFKFNERFSLQPELLYSAQGLKWTDYDENEDIRVFCTVAYDYINVPVLLKINITEGLSAEIGPQIGFLVGANWKHKVNGVSIGGGSITDDCNTIDVTALAGLIPK